MMYLIAFVTLMFAGAWLYDRGRSSRPSIQAIDTEVWWINREHLPEVVELALCLSRHEALMEKHGPYVESEDDIPSEAELDWHDWQLVAAEYGYIGSVEEQVSSMNTRASELEESIKGAVV